MIKVRGLRLDVTLPDESVCVEDFLDKLRACVAVKASKFEISKVALASHLILPKKFTCYIHCRNRPVISPNFETTIEGINIASSLYKKKTRFDLLFGTETAIYKWDKVSRKFQIDKGDERSSKEFLEIPNEELKELDGLSKSTTASRSAVEEIDKLKQLLIKQTEEFGEREDKLKRQIEEHNEMKQQFEEIWNFFCQSRMKESKKFQEIGCQASEESDDNFIKRKSEQEKDDEKEIVQTLHADVKFYKHLYDESFKALHRSNSDYIQTNTALKANISVLQQDKKNLETNIKDSCKDYLELEEIFKDEGIRAKEEINKLQTEVRFLKEELSFKKQIWLKDQTIKGWLTDVHMNMVIDYLKTEVNDNTVKLYNTFAFQMLLKQELTVSQKERKSGIRNSHENKQAELYGLLPVNYPDSHWALLLWKRAEAELFYFDTKGWGLEKELKDSEEGLKHLMKISVDEYNKEHTAPDQKNMNECLKISVFKVNIPKQKNDIDCGPLVLIMIKRLTENNNFLIKKLNSTNYLELLSNLYKVETDALKIRRFLFHLDQFRKT